MDTTLLEDFRSRILPANSVLVVAHDYPDPDCLASAFGISRLVTWWGAKTALVTFGGFVGRAENRAMIRYLDIQTLPIALVHLEDFDHIIMVDTFPGSGNVSLPKNIKIDAVFDHHLESPKQNVAFFHDVRKNIGATSTIVTQYLIEAKCPISAELATALFYGIKTDTGDMGRETSADDLACYNYLFDLIDHKVLAHIENPERDIDYYRVVHRAAGNAVMYNNVGYTHLGHVSAPDYIAEMADFFESLEKLEWMICSGLFKKNIFFSIRTKQHSDAGIRAEKISRKLGGSGGGHSKIGAGKIPYDPAKEDQAIEGFKETFKEIFRIQELKQEQMLPPQP